VQFTQGGTVFTHGKVVFVSISIELDSEIAAAILGTKEFDDPIRRNQLIQTMFEVHLTLRDLRAKCQKSRNLEVIIADRNPRQARPTS
jgi:hypothetical protein